MTLLLSPEEQLLVRATGPTASTRLPSATIRWDDALPMAQWHRVSGLLRRYLKGEAHATHVPPVVLETLRKTVLDTTIKTLRQQAELQTVLAVLATEDIPAMLLKGAALIEAVYPEVGFRPMNDLDILVPRTAIHRAQAVVRAEGYDVLGGKLEPDAERKLQRHHHHFPLMKGGAATIELHHHVLYNAPVAFDISGFWDRAVAGAGPALHLVPCPEDLLLHICVHFAQDRIFRLDAALGQLADIAWTAHHFEIDWDALAARARDYRVGNWLFLALYSATTLVGEIAPPHILTGLRPSSFRPELGDHFVRQRVLYVGTSLPLEQLSAGPRLLLFPTREVLDGYVRPDEDEAPSLVRLHARRAAILFRRLLKAAPWRRHLLADFRLSRWILGLG